MPYLKPHESTEMEEDNSMKLFNRRRAVMKQLEERLQTQVKSAEKELTEAERNLRETKMASVQADVQKAQTVAVAKPIFTRLDRNHFALSIVETFTPKKD